MVEIKHTEIIKILKKHGWIETNLGNGSHKVFIHPETNKRTLISQNHNKDLPPGTLAQIRKQTGIKEIR
ncbi:MAG: type II toxin-antitoxin system HicA family toxin [Synergistaceae bacterium]